MKATQSNQSLIKMHFTQSQLLTKRFVACTILLASALLLILINQSAKVDGFIKFGYILNTTACDICDELRTYSGRNVFCCLAQSKCCGPNSLDELDALTTTQIPVSNP